MRISALVAAAAAALLLAAAPAGAGVHSLPAPDNIAWNGPVGVAEPYPSEINVQGEFGLITDVDVTLEGINTDRDDDLDILLVSPNGDAVVLMSDACGILTSFSGDMHFNQSAPANLSDGDPPCEDGATVKPFDYESGESWVAPPALNTEGLDTFDGENPNGRWLLYVSDDGDESGDTGGTISGWSLDISIAPAAYSIPGSNPIEVDVLGAGQIITDVDVLLDGVSHSRPQDVDMFLEGPLGQKAWLISDVCTDVGYWTDLDFDIDDEGTENFPLMAGETPECDVLNPKPTNYDPTNDNNFPGEAGPPPEGATALSAFDLTDPNGIWKLWIGPDNENQSGFLDDFDLQLETRSPADVGFAVGAQTAPEGSTVTVDVVRGAAAGGLGRGSITVATTSGTAASGSDFTPVSQVLTFEPGETTKSVSVPIAADGQGEPEQGFSIMLGQAEGDAKAGTPAAVGVTIPADAQGPSDDTPIGDQVPPPPATFKSTNVLANPPSTRRCRRKGEVIRFRPVMPAGVGIVRSEVWINGKKIEDNVGVSAIAPIVVTMKGRRMKVRIRLTASDGRQVNIRRTFRRCAAKKRR